MNISRRERSKGIAALVALALVFACMGLFARTLSTGFTLFQQVYLRVIAAFVFGLLFFYKDVNFSKLKKIVPKEYMLLFFRAACQYLFGVVLFSLAITLTKYSSASFIGALPMTALLGIFLLGEQFSTQKIFLVILAFVGVLLISVKDSFSLFFLGRGEIIMLVATFFFSLGYVARKWHSTLLNNKEITLLILFFALIQVFVSSLLAGENLPISTYQATFIPVVVGAGLFNLANLALINYGFQTVEAVVASNILTLESVFAITIGFLFYQEIPSLREFLGGLIIIGSVIKMNEIENKK